MNQKNSGKRKKKTFIGGVNDGLNKNKLSNLNNNNIINNSQMSNSKKNKYYGTIKIRGFEYEKENYSY